MSGPSRISSKADEYGLEFGASDRVRQGFILADT